MITLPSAEARWFVAGSIPKEVRDWFEQGMLRVVDYGQSNQDHSRTDQYLFVPDMPSVGVKLREGKFEVKRRDVDFGFARVGSQNATVRLGLWRKWSFILANKREGEQPPDAHWFSIQKTRLLRKYILKDGCFFPVDPTEPFSTFGCAIELTSLRVQDVNWWSFGFEAFGPDETRLRGTLEDVAMAYFDLDHPALISENSFDYPEWIASLDVRDAPRLASENLLGGWASSG